MEATIINWGSIGIMENKMEVTIVPCAVWLMSRPFWPAQNDRLKGLGFKGLRASLGFRVDAQDAAHIWYTQLLIITNCQNGSHRVLEI